MKAYKTKRGSSNDHGWIVLMLVVLVVLMVGLMMGLYVMLLRPQKDVKQAIQSLRTSMRKGLPFGGPYEQCEDMVCPDFEGKAECMKTKAEDIMKCCQSVCHSKCAHLPQPALEECLEACSPMF